MIRPLSLALFLVVASFSFAAEKDSCEADVFVPQSYEHTPSVWSPDRTKRVQLSSKPKDAYADPASGSFFVSMYSGERPLKTIRLKDLSAGTFVNWSLDSKAFYVMWSDGGTIGGYHVRAFSFDDNGVHELPGPQAVAKKFEANHSCKTRGNNLFAIRWSDGSQRLLLKAQVYPTSDCGKQMGFTTGYLADMESGEILRRYTESQLSEVKHSCLSAVWPTGCVERRRPKASEGGGRS